MRMSDWSSDVCSSDLRMHTLRQHRRRSADRRGDEFRDRDAQIGEQGAVEDDIGLDMADALARRHGSGPAYRSEEHTSELQSLMRISYAVFCLKKKTKNKNTLN